MCSVTTSRPKILRFQKIPAIRTPISLVIASDYEFSRPSAVTSVINRYYDPATDQFISVDPAVAQTNLPYLFTNDDPLNATDPLGFCSWWDVVCPVATAAKWVAHHPLDTVGLVLGIAGAATGVGAVVEIAGGALTLGTGLGVTSIVVGTGATLIDGKSCSNKNKVACVGVVLGATDIITGGIATFGGAGAVSQGFGAFSATVGVAGSVFDVTATATSGQARVVGRSKKSARTQFRNRY